MKLDAVLDLFYNVHMQSPTTRMVIQIYLAGVVGCYAEFGDRPEDVLMLLKTRELKARPSVICQPQDEDTHTRTRTRTATGIDAAKRCTAKLYLTRLLNLPKPITVAVVTCGYYFFK